MEPAGFMWDPHCTGRARWTHPKTGVTALRQPYMRNSDWLKHLAAKIQEANAKQESAHALQ